MSYLTYADEGVLEPLMFDMRSSGALIRNVKRPQPEQSFDSSKEARSIGQERYALGEILPEELSSGIVSTCDGFLSYLGKLSEFISCSPGISYVEILPAF